MGRARYLCTNCRHRFEAEEKENLDCPSCLWSTSVKKEEDVRAAEEVFKSVAGSYKKTQHHSFVPAFLWTKLRFFLTIVAVLVLLVFAVLSGISFMKKFVSGPSKKTLPGAVEIQGAAGKSAKGGSVSGGKAAGVEVPGPGAPGGVSSLSESEKSVLYGQIQISEARQISQEEKQILDHPISFETGIVEKLPSQTWTLENFKQMVAEQEKFYKITLPGGYKGKLDDVFKKHYLPAADAFNAGDLLRARDLWVESLAFPVYGNDVRKHRGVVLTMLRVFINDTLSKIGAINGTIVEKTVREKEGALSRAYQELGELFKKPVWPKAFAKAQEIEKMMVELNRPELLKGSAPSYPAFMNQVDQDIQATLFNILTPPSPSVVDLAPIEQDIQAKKRVIQGFLPENLAAVQKSYDEALQLIREKRWAEAVEKLKAIAYPPALAKDAAKKVKILQKLTRITP